MRCLLVTLALAVVLCSADASGVPVFEWLGAHSTGDATSTARVSATTVERREVSFREDHRCVAYGSVELPPNAMQISATMQSYLTCEEEQYDQQHTADDRIFSPDGNKLGSAGVCVVAGITYFPTADPMLSTGAGSVTCNIRSADNCGHPSCNGLRAAGGGMMYAMGRAIALRPSSGINYQCANGGVRPGVRMSSPRGPGGPADAREPTTAPTTDAGNTQRRQLRYNSYDADDVDVAGLVCVGPAIAFTGSLAVTPQDDHMPYQVAKATYSAFMDRSEPIPDNPLIDCTMTLAEVEAKYGSNLPVIEPGKWTFTFEEPAREY